MASVVSLLIERADRPDRLLMGIRDPRVNTRHPGVLSTITQRVPAFIADALTVTTPATQGVGAGHGPRGALSYVAESALCRKLDASSLLESGLVSGTVSFARHMAETVDDPLGTQLSEPTSMVTLRLLLERGADRLPTSSTSYLLLDWVDKTNLGRAFRTRDALILVPEADPFMVCIHGLCVRSAIATLDEAMQSIA